jgi:hypothetical protein
MASSVSSFSGQFPPPQSLAHQLIAAQSSPLPTNLYADKTGYPQGLRVSAALNENDSGRFSLASGLTLGASAAKIAEREVERIQDLLNSVVERTGTIASDTIDEIERTRQREILKDELREIDRAIKDAQLGDFNLLSASQARGVALNIGSGSFGNVPSTPRVTVSGEDRTFRFDPNEISFETVDLDAALQDLRELEVLTAPGGDGGIPNVTSTISRFQNTLNQSRDALSNFRNAVAQAAVDNLTISGDTANEISSSDEARQLASRLAQQLSQESLTISANPAAKYFSLFT